MALSCRVRIRIVRMNPAIDTVAVALRLNSLRKTPRFVSGRALAAPQKACLVKPLQGPDGRVRFPELATACPLKSCWQLRDDYSRLRSQIRESDII